MKTRFFFLLMCAALLCPAADARSENSKTLYTCGMHPQIIQDHPGNCPICGMKLTPIRNSGGADTNPASSSAIAVDAATQQNMNLRTAEVQRGPLRKTIRTVGAIDYNETALADVTTKFKGWVEKLDVDATGQLVHRGEPMFEIYSPELYSAEAEFLLALNSGGDASSPSTPATGASQPHDPAAAALRETAANKLRFFDVPDTQIAELEKTRQPKKTLPVAAPISGFVIEKNVVQGQMVDAGMKLYRLADLGIVWVIAQIYEQDLPFIKLGQEAVVKVTSLPDREFRGRVTFVYPSVDEKTRTAKVRLEFENPGYFLKPGMFVSAQIQAELEDSAVLVPESAVLRSGEKNTVFIVRAGGKFEARDVALGMEAENDLVQVVGGVNAGERIVTSGQFLLDSESQLREAIEKMRGSGGAGFQPASAQRESNVSVNAADVAGWKPAPLPASVNESPVYVCPMPEHVSIIYDHAGSCPICGMTLVPVKPSVLKKIQPGGKVLYYTCPMPEDASVHEDKPGKCPRCGMTLIPVMSAPTNSAFAAAIAAPVKTDSASTTNALAKQKYYCPMHPDVISDEPGKCPKCEMDLVPMEK